jgi:hypothetical protein
VGDADKFGCIAHAALRLHKSDEMDERKEDTSMPFAVPMIWHGPRRRLEDCYFCLTKIERLPKKS